jgi:hypothetical protein
MKKNIKKGVSGGKIAAVGAGVAALAGGAYYLLGPKAKVHQKKASILMAKMKKEVASEIKKAKEISTPLYHKVVDVVAENYAEQYKMHEGDIKTIAKKLKGEWKSVSRKAPKKPVSKKKK